MVEKLYGVVHGKSLNISDVPIARFETKPSKELVEELLSLPQNTSVGIEYAPEIKKAFVLDGVPVDTSGSEYWRDIVKICEQQKLKTVYLDDFSTYEKYASKYLEKERLDKMNMEKYIKSLEKDPLLTTEEYEENSEVRKLIRKAYKAGVEAEHILVIEREQKMFDKIAEYQPKVVILGKGHADYIMLKPEEFTSRKIPLGEYKVENNGVSRFNLESDGLLDRELLIRKYRAITEGRIMSGGTPDYIGSWDLTIPARGLFEIYLDPRNSGMTGVIEDTLGSATFVGVITEVKALFGKNYKPEMSSQKAVQESLSYEGMGHKGVYWGKYRAVSGFTNNKEYQFAMKKFSNTEKLNLA
jgi:hypothetical protein